MNHDYYNIINIDSIEEYDKDICSNIYIVLLDEFNILFKNIPYKKIYGPPEEFSYFKKIINHIIDIINLFENDENNIKNFINRIVAKDIKEVVNIVDFLVTNELNKVNNNSLFNEFLKKSCLFSNIIEKIYMILHFFHFKSDNFKLNTLINKKNEILIDNKKFSIMKNNVNNFDYFNFVLNDGYFDLQYWSEKGKIWLKNYPKKHPYFWKKFGDIWYIRKFDKFYKLESIFDQPIDNISYYEAEAFCNYKNGYLPTINELNFIIDKGQYHSFTIGNVWEWTKSNYNSETSLCFGGSKYNRIIINDINDRIIVKKNAQHYFTGFRIVFKN